MEEQASVEHPTSQPLGDQIPVSCPECNGPLYEVRQGQLSRFQCFVGHSYSLESLSEQHTEALKRALWTAIRKLKERIVLHQELSIARNATRAEDELCSRLEESVVTAERDLKLLRELLDRI